ncbi:MAG: VIT domain-containing protein [Planctomycetales bacterium]
MLLRMDLRSRAWAVVSGLCWCAFVAAESRPATAQTVAAPSRALAAQVVVPQSRAFAIHGTPHGVRPVSITGVEVGVVVSEQVATTTIDVALSNPNARVQEAEIVLPVPDGSVVRGFSFQGSSSEPTAQLLPKDEARRIYDSIVSKSRDPALLEFVGTDVIRSSVFPVPAGGTQKVRITYEQVLTARGAQVDYVLPRTDALDYRTPWKISVRIKSKRPIATVYSPSHAIEMTRAADGIVSARIADAAATEPGAFRLSYLLQQGSVTASLMAYPDPSGRDGGYFLLLAGMPHEADGRETVSREVTLVIDRSGSMNGEKFEQAREAALQVLAGLRDGERFNVIDYSDNVRQFSDAPLPLDDAGRERARRYIAEMRPMGGTNIHAALSAALRQSHARGTLPLVLFLTDGLPTTGNTSEEAIRELAETSNPHGRRIFTFGVGVDVNTPLLSRLASVTRAKATFVLPKEDVEVKVGQVFAELEGPVLVRAKLEAVDAEGSFASSRVHEMFPADLPDLFLGDQLVVLGRYDGRAPLSFRLAGTYLGRSREFRFHFPLENAGERNAFVGRLWASRKIGVLNDAIRQFGATDAATAIARSKTDARLKELTEEILRLTKDFGILSEYTAFLAREGTDLTKSDEVLAEAQRNFTEQAVAVRSGTASVSQEVNNDARVQQSVLNSRNSGYDRNLNRVEVANVQQINGRGYFRRGNQWIDGRLTYGGRSTQADRVIEFDTEEYRQLVEQLLQAGRQNELSLQGDVLLEIDGRTVLVKCAKPAEGGR